MLESEAVAEAMLAPAAIEHPKRRFEIKSKLEMEENRSSAPTLN